MNLMDVLLFQDRNELIKLVKERDVSPNINSKRELIEVIYPSLVNVEHLSKRFRCLSTAAQNMALALCYDKKIMLSKEELNGFSPHLKGKPFDELMEELTKNGFLFSYVDRNYLVPSQIKKGLLRLIQKRLEDDRLILPPFSNEDREITIVNDIFAFIDYVAGQPLSLTKTGVMYKKDFNLVMKDFSYKEELPKEQWRFGYGRRFSQYPDRFSLIYDFCFYKGWLSENESILTVQKQVEELYNMRIHELIGSIIIYWQKLYRRPFPNVSILYEIVLNTLKEGEGIEEEHLLATLSPFVTEYYFDKKEDVVKKRFINVLMYLNVIKKVELNYFIGYTVGPSLKFLK
jgi:hypothetical protein